MKILFHPGEFIGYLVNSLVRVRQAAHSTHHAQHVVVGSIHTHGGAGRSTNGVVGDGQQQSGVIDTGQVASARGLVLLRGQGEGVYVHTHGRHVGVVLVRLHLVEVAALTHGKPVVAVELEQGSHHRVTTSHALHAGHGVARLQGGAIPPVRVVERLLALPGVDHVVIARHEGIALHNPHELLTRVVEVQLDLVGGGVDGLTTSELEGLDQVLVGHLGELAALISVQVDVIHVERGGHQVGGVHAIADHVGVGVLGSVVPAEILQIIELQIDAHLVVLEGDQGQGQTRVAAEPELQRDVQSVLRGASEELGRGVGLAASALVVAILTTLHDQIGQVGHVTHHLGVAGLLTGLLGELVPDVQPVTIVLVNALTTDLELDVVDQIVANPVEPAELSTRTVRGLELHLGQSGLQVHAVDQVAVALDSAGHLVTEARVAVEGILNGLHREVGVTAVHRLEESDLGIARQIHVLSSISY